MPEFDHVIFTVRNFDVAAERLQREHGLGSLPGGTHPGHGTGNRIVPLRSAYLELMAVVDEDEAGASPLGQWVRDRVRGGDGPAAVCLRTEDIEAVAGRLGLEPVSMSRDRPDGDPLTWRLAGLDRMLADGFPFFIEWTSDPEDFPGRMQATHGVRPRGIAWVEIGADASDLDEWVGPHDLDLRAVGGRDGVRRVAIDTGSGRIVV